MRSRPTVRRARWPRSSACVPTSTLLDETLAEEGQADKRLTKLAAGGVLSSGINHFAAVRAERARSLGGSSSRVERMREFLAEMRLAPHDQANSLRYPA